MDRATCKDDGIEEGCSRQRNDVGTIGRIANRYAAKAVCKFADEGVIDIDVACAAANVDDEGVSRWG